MLWKASDLLGFSIRAKDGVIGEIADLFFSDDSWTVRYLVVATGEWLKRREVLISPMVLEDPPNGPAKVLPVNVNRSEVQDAPPVDSEKPVSRHYEVHYSDFYRLPYYWAGGPGWGPFLTPGELARSAGAASHDIEPPEHPHLRSAEEVRGYHFEGVDGKLGHVEDFIVSDESWSIRYLEIDVRNWLPGGKKVLLATRWVSGVSWEKRLLKAEMSREAVKNAPEYDDSVPISEAYEIALAKHYGLERSVGAFR
ncbi:MAG TPA: PRC-barrel domain-containing protein [Vicinamibacteria bacterium]|nr:PRC-barrel domain-containing protein [Vicinamibacteria bacterium]